MGGAASLTFACLSFSFEVVSRFASGKMGSEYERGSQAVDSMAMFKSTYLDFVLRVFGLFFNLLDTVLDALAVVSSYQEKAYVTLAILVILLVGSSLLVQFFSWVWYSPENLKEYQNDLRVHRLSPGKVKLLHVLQCGIYFRHAGIVEHSLRSLCDRDRDRKELAACLTNDLSILQLIEAFSENAPQLVVMLAIILRQNQLKCVRVLKAFSSALAIALSMTMCHRTMRSSAPDKEKQGVVSSLVYYLWNLFLLLSRLAALALFASVLPCFIFTHFLCSWLIFLFFFVWRVKTDAMDSLGGEWLYRATIGLIWYFTWVNVVKGRTRDRTLLYHCFILADTGLLCGLWCWKILSMERPFFTISPPVAAGVASGIVVVYMVGLAFKVVYYRFFHPNIAKEELKGHEGERSPDKLRAMDTRMMDNMRRSDDKKLSYRMACIESDSDQRTEPHCNKRMRTLAVNFYCDA